MKTKDPNALPYGLIVRDYREEDYPGLVSLWERTGLDDKKRGDDSEAISRTLELGGKMLVAVLPGGEVIASSWITCDGRRLHLHHVGVLPEYRRRGIGKKISLLSIDYARQKNLQVKLEVHRSNRAAVELYRSLGFKYLGDYDVYIMRKFRDLCI